MSHNVLHRPVFCYFIVILELSRHQTDRSVEPKPNEAYKKYFLFPEAAAYAYSLYARNNSHPP